MIPRVPAPHATADRTAAKPGEQYLASTSRERTATAGAVAICRGLRASRRSCAARHRASEIVLGVDGKWRSRPITSTTRPTLGRRSPVVLFVCATSRLACTCWASGSRTSVAGSTALSPAAVGDVASRAPGDVSRPITIISTNRAPNTSTTPSAILPALDGGAFVGCTITAAAGMVSAAAAVSLLHFSPAVATDKRVGLSPAGATLVHSVRRNAAQPKVSAQRQARCCVM